MPMVIVLVRREWEKVKAVRVLISEWFPNIGAKMSNEIRKSEMYVDRGGLVATATVESINANATIIQWLQALK